MAIYLTSFMVNTVSPRSYSVFNIVSKHIFILILDIINVRFFLYVIKKSNPELVLQQLLRMLKPNGWIQWAEQDLKTARIVAAKPDSKPTYTEALMDFATAPTPSFTAE